MVYFISTLSCTISDSVVTSNDKDASGNPLLELSGGVLRVKSFAQLTNILRMAKEKRLNEARMCLEGRIVI